MVSIDQPMDGKGDEAGRTLGAVLSSPALRPEEALAQAQRYNRVRAILKETLSDREVEVIRCHYGLKNGHTEPLARMCDDLNVSRERIRQIESAALAKLRRAKRLSLLREFLEAL